MDPRAIAVLGSLGAYPAGFSARTLTEPLMAAAHLVLTAQRRHRAAAVALHPRSHTKTFTILQFARLVRHVNPNRLPESGVVSRTQSLVREAARLRGASPPPASVEDDIADPYGRSAKDFHTCAAIIDAALDQPLRLILG
jgi:protein-tyrosine phosphatase